MIKALISLLPVQQLRPCNFLSKRKACTIAAYLIFCKAITKFLDLKY
jgi:hypothetical protein